MYRYGPHFLPVYPTCGHKTAAFQCISLTMAEIMNFHSKFYEVKQKIYQDNFILKYCKTIPVKRKRPKNSRHSQKIFQAQFFVLSQQKKFIPVCKKSFMEILGITRRRIDTVTKNYFRTSLPAQENRGGDTKSEKYQCKKQSVMNFINKFKAIESHYCRGQSERLYLDSSLNITKMWTMYQIDNNEQPVKKSYFRHIFNTQYNLGFGTPRTDVCSTCLQLTEKIKRCSDEKIKVNLMTEKRVHKMRAQAYFSLLRQAENGVVIYSFDCQKNQVLPKVPDQQAYYSRQLYIYNFTVVRGTSKSKLNSSTVTSFCWTENEYSKGSNEIASCIHHILNTSDFTNIHTVRLMCDGCGGQNKNTTLLTMCCNWLCKQNLITNIEVIFPVRGHSFIPPDRVFGHIERDIRKKEIILEPEEYMNIISQYATVLKVGEDVEIKNWKDETRKFIKLPGQWHFAFSKMKRMILTKNSNGVVIVRGESNYRTDLGVGQSITKRGKSIPNMDPTLITKKNAVTENKKVDVNNLLFSHYGEDWKSDPRLTFYKFVLEGEDQPEDTEDGETTVLCEAREEECGLTV